MLISRSVILVGVALSSLLSNAIGAETITEPASGSLKGIPATTKVAATNVNDTKCYDMRLQLKLTENSEFFDVGATDTFCAVSSWSGTIGVVYNPGPGQFAGRAILNSAFMGQFTEVAHNDFTWQGQPQP